jgi:hypothetical protein
MSRMAFLRCSLAMSCARRGNAGHGHLGNWGWSFQLASKGASLAMAMAMRGELAGEVIVHADRGCQVRFKGSLQHRLTEGIVDVR